MNLSKRDQRNKDPVHNKAQQHRGKLIPLWLCLLCSVWFWGAAWAAVDVVDDSGQRIRLAQPAQRIISLAPHITELLYEIGAGEKIVGTVEYSDYPPDAKAIPRIGRHNALDLETVVMLKPDIVIAWQSGNPVHHVEKIMSLGIPVYFSEPVKLPDVADTLKRFGQLAGLAANAQQAQRQYIQRYQRLKQSNQHKSKVRVFYEIWNRPMMSINGKHIVNEVIELCGGDNVFKTLRPLTPTVDVEAVIKVDPEVIIASGVGEAPPPWLGEWDAWPQITAVKKRQVYHINPDYIHRQTSRILIGAERLCALLDKARKP